MANTKFYSFTYLLLFIFIFFSACIGQEKSLRKIKRVKAPFTNIITSPSPQISEYIRNIHQDKNGNLWFGTNGFGVAHYDGDSISYFSNAQGFDGQQITGMTEDPNQNIWFATDQGIVKDFPLYRYTPKPSELNQIFPPLSS